MGNKWEVWAWMRQPNSKANYDWVPVYQGPSMCRALWVAWKSKRDGIGCVKVEWR